jgi:3-deoxy-manno-octulosonate cytidylyltransferase (CMP-KDO synthetase)
MKSLEASENWNNCVTWNWERIKMVETTHVGIGIDTPEDLERD